MDSDLIDTNKATVRRAALAQRRAVFDAEAAALGAAQLLEALEPHVGRTVAGYLPIGTEIDPRPAMVRMTETGHVVVPVVESAGRPLKFGRWTPDCETIGGPYGIPIPVNPVWLEPDVLIVPLVAFTRCGERLGYGGGFYDRTLARLRANRPIFAIGFAFAAQEVDGLPLESTDQRLDMIVTEVGIVYPQAENSVASPGKTVYR